MRTILVRREFNALEVRSIMLIVARDVTRRWKHLVRYFYRGLFARWIER